MHLLAGGFALQTARVSLTLWSPVQGGCIIRAVFLDDIYQAYKRTPDLENLMMDQEFGSKLVNSEKAWRSVVIKVSHPAPAAVRPAMPLQL